MNNGQAHVTEAPVPESPIRTSVIIPVYNVEAYLEECLDSVFAQDQEDFEVICVDDGSTDGSLAILRRYAKSHPNMVVVTQRHDSLGAARNHGVEHARGEFVCFVDSGGLHDRSGRGYEGKTMSGVEFCGRAMAGGDFLVMAWLGYLRRSFVLEHGLHFEEGIAYEDNDWTLRVYLAASRMRYLPHALYLYRVRKGSILRSAFDVMKARSCERIHGILIGMYERCGSEGERAVVRFGFYSIEGLLSFQDTRGMDEETHEECRAIAGRLLSSLENDVVRDGMEWLVLIRCHFVLVIMSLARTRRCHSCDSGDVGAGEEAPMSEAERALLDGSRHAALYGGGLLTDCLMELLALRGESLSKDVPVLDTRAPSGGTYQGHTVINVRDAPGLGLDTIVICSLTHADEMERTVREVLGGDVEILRATISPSTLRAFL